MRTNPVVRLSAETGKTTVFKTDLIPGFDFGAAVETSTFGFAVGAGGKVYELVRELERHDSSFTDETYLVAFSSTGEFAWKSKFTFTDGFWLPQRFLPLPSGDFLVGGVKGASEKGVKRTFTAIFGADAPAKTLRLAIDE